MENDNLQNSIKNNILEKIKSDEVKMTSKQYFFMKSLTMLLPTLSFCL